MEPKFQSSFIPRGPVSTSTPNAGMSLPRRKQRDLFSLIATLIFTLSIASAGGVFLYKYFLNYRISQMKGELEAARASLEPETVNELVRLNSRIVSTNTLLKSHRIISPVFGFLQDATPRSVRYTDFSFNSGAKGLELNLRGEARSYAALAVAADILSNKNPRFREVSFSDLSLDEKGNVLFSLYATVDPAFLSYDRYVQAEPVPVQNPQSVATTTPRESGTSTPPTGPANLPR